jgi:molybdenum cofactor synthesis domain-containing protein
MRPFTSTISFADALRIVVDAAIPIDDVERIALGEADGRVAARAVASEVDVPAFDRAAMDGYAVVADDTAAAGAAAPATLVCVDRLFTGQIPSRGIRRGECIEIATGAPLPDGATAVVMVEATERQGQHVRVLAPVSSRQNVGARGADMAAGQTVVAAGDRLTPSRIGALAGTGATTIDVYRRPSVAIISTGNEVAEPGGPLAPGQVYNINRFTLAAVVRRHGSIAAPLSTAADTLEELSAGVDAARAHDVLVFSGGSSVGDRDLVLDALRQHGDILFHGVDVKPGKPTAFGRIGRTFVFGMPGYPTSCLSNAYMLLVPFLRKMARLPEWRPVQLELPLSRRVTSVPGRHQFYTVRVVDGRAEPAFKASGDITSMANADGYIEIPATTDVVEAGTVVTVKLF